MFLQDIIIGSEKKGCKLDQDKVQVQDGHLEDTICLKKRFKIYQGKVQFQDGHLEETICLKLAIYI